MSFPGRCYNSVLLGLVLLLLALETCSKVDAAEAAVDGAAVEGPGGHVTVSAQTNSSSVGVGATQSRGNDTDTSKGPKKGPGGFGMHADSNTIQRALYVLIGCTMIGVLYFLVRAVRLKRPGSKRKYGLLSNYEDSVEMMENGESEEDDTLYDAQTLRNNRR